ncbi:MAG: Chromosome partitioning protein, ParB family [Sporanaerobacter sp.]|jgi:ParB family transcriptional regulator, chromosome partitioning protein|uniref:ParB/RepB/Spo0J family partition protein n=1 Tax=Sporanaerobacter sp. TaxID=2010183 RepID=UPI003A0FE2F0
MVAKKKGLGKGLSALIPDEPIEDFINFDEEKDNILSIDISQIKPNKNQPRKEFDEKSLKELSDSIKTYGVIQPIIVRKIGKNYEIIAGERRWRASKIAGLEEVPCLVKDVEEFESIKMALIENIQREDLNPIEEAKAFRELMDNYNLTQEEVSQIVGKSRSYIANSIRLLNLDKKTLDYIEEGSLSSGHGRALLSIGDENERAKIANEIINKKLNVRDTEELAKNMKKSKKHLQNKSKETYRDPIILNLEEELMAYLGTKVQIAEGKNKGKIEIEYYGDEDLERILETIMNK